MMEKSTLKLIECPRDAMQGWMNMIPTEKKIRYLNALLKVGFHTLDFGSFVSEKAIPQMADTKTIIPKLEVHNSSTRLLAIIANLRGAIDACVYDEVTYLGFPFSVSETFQQLNTNSSVEESLKRVEEIQTLCLKTGKKLVIYISMGFGNPYGDPYHEEIVVEWVEKLIRLDIKTISLADTVGLATPDQVSKLTRILVDSFPGTELGVHLHSTPTLQDSKLEAALQAGCHRFDGALLGIGGCPMANNDLVGNLKMEAMISFFEKNQVPTGIHKPALEKSIELASEIFV